MSPLNIRSSDGIELEQPPVEQRGGFIGNRRDERKALLHKNFLCVGQHQLISFDNQCDVLGKKG